MVQDGAYLQDWEHDPDEIEGIDDLSQQRKARTFTDITSKGKDDVALELNIARSYQKKILEDDEQLVFPILGKPGVGKSTLMLWIEYFLFGEINFNTTCFQHGKWKDLATDDEHGKVIKYEEGRQTFVKRRAMSSNNKDGLDILSIFRARNNVHFICFQNIEDIEEDLLFFHADGLLWCHKVFGRKGYVSGYSPKTLRSNKFRSELDDGTLVPGDHKDVVRVFPDFKEYYPEKWKKYENIKDENLKRIRHKYVDDDE